MNCTHKAKLSELLKEYQYILVDKNTCNKNLLENSKTIIYSNENIIPTEKNHITPLKIANYLLEKLNKKAYIAHKIEETLTNITENLKDCDIVIVLNDKLNENNQETLNTNKTIYLLSEQEKEYENSITKQHMNNSNNVELLTKTSPLFYEYIFSIFETRNILSIETSNENEQALKMNNIDYIILENKEILTK